MTKIEMKAPKMRKRCCLCIRLNVLEQLSTRRARQLDTISLRNIAKWRGELRQLGRSEQPARDQQTRRTKTVMIQIRVNQRRETCARIILVLAVQEVQELIHSVATRVSQMAARGPCGDLPKLC
jgi:hypothetical protein